MKNNWQHLINPPLTYNKKNQNARNECRWEPPPKGSLKLNFDGASRGNPCKMGLGCIIHSDSGGWIIKRAKPMGIETNNITKLEALQVALFHSLRKKIR